MSSFTVEERDITLQSGVIISTRIHKPTLPISNEYCIIGFNAGFNNKHLWDITGAILANAGVAFIAHDIRGAGNSIPLPKKNSGSEQFTFDQYAEDAAEVIHILNFSKAIAWGTAWGSRAALVYAATQEKNCIGAILGDFSVGNSLDKEWPALQKMSHVLAQEKVQRLNLYEDNYIDEKKCHVHKWTLGSRLAMHATSKGIYKDAAKFSAMALKRSYNFPIVIYTGEFDPNLVANPGGSMEAYNTLKEMSNDVALIVPEACGHNMLQDRPKYVSEIALDFCLDRIFKQSLNLIGAASL